MNEINDFGLFLLDVYAINYYGVLVFFQICKTTEKTVFLVELGTKKYKNGITLTKGLKTSKNPYIITNNNTHRKSQYEVTPLHIDSGYVLPIKVDYCSPLFRAALAKNKYPITGVVLAYPVWEYANKYWIIEENEEITELPLA